MSVITLIKVGLTLDTGALIALESKDRRMKALVERAAEMRSTVTVPTPVIAEWWRGGRQQRRVLEGFALEQPSPRLAKIAGEALATLDGVSAVDAIVMASAAQRGDIVFTSDFPDLQKLQQAFPNVRLFRA